MTTASDTIPASPPAPPQWSADGLWWWTGEQWIAASALPPVATAAATRPADPLAGTVHRPDARRLDASVTAVLAQTVDLRPVEDEVPAERVVARAELHWAWAFSAGIGCLLAALVTGTVVGVVTDATSGVSAFMFLVVCAAALGGFGLLRQGSCEMVLSTRRLTIGSGVMHRRSVDLPLQRVESVEVEQGFLGAWLGYGTLVVYDVAMERELVPGVVDPQRLRLLITQQLAAARAGSRA